MSQTTTIQHLTALVTRLTELLLRCARDRDSLTRYAGALANDLRRETDQHVACHLLAIRLARMGDPTDPDGVADRQTVTLTNLVDQAAAALAGEHREESDGG